MEVYNEIRRQAVENAALLWSFSELPEDPRENATVPFSSAWKLPIDREKQLADDLAFIASSEEDPNQVMAVCVEEHQDRNGMTVRVASNAGDTSHTVQKLQAIANIMVQAGRRDVSRCQIKGSLFERIVVMCSNRIMSRLRSKHAARTRKTAGKPSLPPMLLDTVRQCQRLARGNAAKVVAAKTRSQCELLNNVFERIEDLQDDDNTVKSLTQLLTLAHEFDIDALVATMRQFPTLDPTLRKYLPEAVRKLGRYHEVAINLTNAARTAKHSLFHNIVVAAAECNKIDTQSLKVGLCDFDTALSRVTDKWFENRSSSLRAIARTKYQDRIYSCRTRWKVHAEIQILLFYELNPQQTQPRIICASKSACYLCDLFFQAHGRFKVPRTHGRIYDKWVLPDWPIEQAGILHAINPVIERFNSVLETKILKVFGGQRARRSHPNESVVGIYEPWSSNSTLRAVQATATDTLDPTEAPVSVLEDSSTSQSACGLPTPQLRCNLLGNKMKKNFEAVEAIANEQHVAQSHTPTSLTLLNGETSAVAHDSASCLSQGERFCKEIRDGESISVQTSTIHFDFSIVGTLDDLADRNIESWSAFLVAVEQSRHGSEASNAALGACVVDLDSLQPGHDTVIPVGAAIPSTTLLCRSNGQEIAVKFGLPKVEARCSAED